MVFFLDRVILFLMKQPDLKTVTDLLSPPNTVVGWILLRWFRDSSDESHLRIITDDIYWDSSECTQKVMCNSRLNIFWNIGLAVRVFAKGPGDRGLIPDRVIPKTPKMVIEASLQNTQHYKVRIKGKGEQSREMSSALITPQCSGYWKGSLRVSLNYGSPTLLIVYNSYLILIVYNSPYVFVSNAHLIPDLWWSFLP